MSEPLSLEAIEAKLDRLAEETGGRWNDQDPRALIAEVRRLRTAFATLDYILGNIDFAADVYEERWGDARELVGWTTAWGDGLLEVTS